MNHWSEYPFVRILFAFIAGVLLYLFTFIHFPGWLLFLSFFLALLVHLLSGNKTVRLYRHSHLIGLSIQVSFFILGNFLTGYKIDLHDSNHFTHFTSESDWAIVKVTQPPVEKEKSFKVAAEVLSNGSGNTSRVTCGQTILYFEKDSVSGKLMYGDVLLIKNNFQPVAAPKNPDEFNYRQYLWYKEIYETAYLRSGEWKQLPVEIKNPVFQLTYWLQSVSLQAIRKYINPEREASVAEALVIGYRDDMSFDIQQSYTIAGVVHVLAVSGLHVGILFAFLHQVLFFLNRKKHGKVIQSAIIIIIIWLFAFLTGLSGSVIRAATMFSFVTIGKNLRRPVSINNVLACSALFILFYNPLLIMDAGLQLSYVAVFGISTLYPHINRLVQSENKFINLVWSTMAMSIAAQIATLPITLFYFNQFPTYFLLANLLVIPGAAAILYLGIFLILFQFVTPVAAIIGKITCFITWLLNEYILRIQSLPRSVIHLPATLFIEAILLSLFIIFAARYFITHSKRFMTAAIACMLLLAISKSASLINTSREKTITIYSMKGKSNLEFRNGSEAVFFTNDDQLTPSEEIYFNHHWQLNNIKGIQRFPSLDSTRTYLRNQLYQHINFFQFYQYQIVVIHDSLQHYIPEHKLHLDAVVISSNPNLNINTLLDYFDTKMIVFDVDNPSYKIKEWKKEADALGLKTYDVSTLGAFVRQIDVPVLNYSA
jgi:competence protein ComEC